MYPSRVALVLTAFFTAAATSSAQTQQWRRITPTTCAAADSAIGVLPARFETKVEANQNRFRASSSYRSEAHGAGGGRWSLSGNGRGGLQVWFQHTDREGQEPGYVMMFQQRSQEWQYLRDRELNLILNGADRLPLGNAVRQGEVTRAGTSVGVIEVLAVALTPEQAIRIATADTVEGEIGRTQFQLQPRHREGLASVVRMVTCASGATPDQ